MENEGNCGICELYKQSDVNVTVVMHVINFNVNSGGEGLLKVVTGGLAKS